MKIIDAGNTTRADRVLARDRAADRALERRVAAIVERVRRGRRSRARPLRAEVRRPDAAARGLARRDAQRRGAWCRSTCGARSGRPRRNIARVAFRQIPKHWDIRVSPGVSVEQRVEPLARVGCYVPGGRFPLPSSLLMTAVPARVAGVPEVDRRVPAPRAGRDGGGARGRRHAAVPRRRRARDRRAGVRHRDDSARRQDRRPGNRYVAAAKALVSADCAIDFYAGPTEIVIVAGRAAGRRRGSPPTSSRRPNTIPTRGRSSSPGTARSPSASPRAVARAGRRPRRSSSESLAAHGAIVVAGRADEAMALANRIAPEHLVVDRESLIAAAAHRRRGVRRPVHAPRRPATTRPARITCCRRRARRASAAACRAADFVRVMSVQRLTRAGLAALAPTIVAARARRGPARPRRVDRHPSAAIPSVRVMPDYDKPPELYDGLRLHQNENTGGCSPRVTRGARHAPPRPDRLLPAVRGARSTRVRRYLGVPPASAGADQRARRGHHGRWRSRTSGRRPERLVPEAIVPRAGVRDLRSRHRGRRRPRGPGRAETRLQLSARRGARRRSRRTNARRLPDQPEQSDRRRRCRSTRFGRSRGDVPAGADRLRRRGLRRVRRGRPSSPSSRAFPNVIVGRTFSKAFGLAGLRIGASIGAPGDARPDPAGDPGLQRQHRRGRRRRRPRSRIRRIIEDYLRQVARIEGAASTPPAIVSALHYWKSDANFVLVRAGEHAPRARRAARPHAASTCATARREPGCAGCIRITTGIVEHTRRGIAVLEEVLCAAR